MDSRDGQTLTRIPLRLTLYDHVAKDQVQGLDGDDVDERKLRAYIMQALDEKTARLWNDGDMRLYTTGSKPWRSDSTLAVAINDFMTGPRTHFTDLGVELVIPEPMEIDEDPGRAAYKG